MNICRDLKTSIFKNWIKWDECDDKIMKTILFFMQWAIYKIVIWFSYLSQIKKRDLSFVFSRVFVSNIKRNHYNSCILFVQFFVLQSNLQLLWILINTHWRDKFSFLNMIKNESEVSSIANSLSFILYKFSNSILCLSITFCKFSNHFHQSFCRYIFDFCCFNQFHFSIFKLKMTWYKSKDSIFVKWFVIDELNIIIVDVDDASISNDFDQFTYDTISKNIIMLCEHCNSMS